MSLFCNKFAFSCRFRDILDLFYTMLLCNWFFVCNALRIVLKLKS